MIQNLRARLTLWYVGVLTAVLVAVCILIYVLLGRSLYARLDGNLRAVTGIAVTSLTNDLAEGQSVSDAAKSTAAELASEQATLAIHDGSGRRLAEQGFNDDLEVGIARADTIPIDTTSIITVSERDDADDRHRIAVRRARIAPSGTEYIIIASTDLEATEEELESLRTILLYVVPAALVIAGIVGWFMARHSLSPVVVMAERARRMGVESLGGRLPVANPHDELGRLAGTFNELLGRLEASFATQRQFMADASHELRTPLATARTAAGVALQQPHRAEDEYRETLRIIEQQTTRLTRVVEDMFILARADAGNYPTRPTAVYLDELVDEVVRAARILAAGKSVIVELAVTENAIVTGDEDLLKRMVTNLVDNAVKHTPPGGKVRVALACGTTECSIDVSDTGDGIPADAQPHVFERFYRGDAARQRGEADVGGAGLGLAIARWVAQVHHGDVTLVHSRPGSTTFRVSLAILPEVRQGALP
jgi:two-component system OmpR family sensor kinase